MELSINFIVIFILAMSMFAAGLSISRKIFFEADEMKQKLTEQQKSQLESILRQGGDKVKATYVKKTIEPGGNDVFGIGVRNDYGTERNFFVETNLDAAFEFDDSEICDEDTMNQCDLDPNNNKYDEWFYLDTANTAGPVDIQSNDLYVQDIFVIIPKRAVKGTYIFNVAVCVDDWCSSTGTGYGTIKKLNVIVK